MVLAETIIFGPIGSALIVAWLQLFRMEDDKRDKLDDEVSQSYKYLRDNTLDPILQQILSSKTGRFKPEKFFSTPEVVEKLTTYKSKLFQYNEVSGKRNTILTMLSLSFHTAIILGVTTLLLTGFNELFVNSDYNMTFLKTIHIAALTAIVLGIGLIFLGSFIYQYRSNNTSFKNGIRALTGGIK